MKKVLFIVVLLFVAVFANYKFSEGYQDGYKAGACYRCFGCISPIPPIPPIPRIGEETYMDGFKRGFLNGLKVNKCNED